jgi:hypothetical protein
MFVKRIARLSFSSFLAFGLATAALAGPPAAIPNPDPAHARAERSFDEFAKGWMQKMARLETANRAKVATAGGYRGYEDDYVIELKPTGSSTAPWVGILRYHELTYTCADKTAASCTPSKKTRVSEIFRFQGGKWVY